MSRANCDDRCESGSTRAATHQSKDVTGGTIKGRGPDVGWRETQGGKRREGTREERKMCRRKGQRQIEGGRREGTGSKRDREREGGIWESDDISRVRMTQRLGWIEGGRRVGTRRVQEANGKEKEQESEESSGIRLLRGRGRREKKKGVKDGREIKID